MPAYAQSPIPGINISVDTATTPKQVSTTLQIVFLLTILTLAPAILIMTTSFTRFVIVLSFLRQAIGTPQAPSNQIVIGIALFLTYLASKSISVRELRNSYPNYFISKNKILLNQDTDIDKVLSVLQNKYRLEKITNIDGLKIDFSDGWVHLRKSNTEPVIRIYAESEGKEKAEKFAQMMINEVKIV